MIILLLIMIIILRPASRLLKGSQHVGRGPRSVNIICFVCFCFLSPEANGSDNGLAVHGDRTANVRPERTVNIIICYAILSYECMFIYTYTYIYIYICIYIYIYTHIHINK